MVDTLGIQRHRRFAGGHFRCGAQAALALRLIAQFSGPTAKMTNMPGRERKRGPAKKVARPAKKLSKTTAPPLGSLKGKIEILGDIVSPIESPDAWQYDLNNLDKKTRRQS
jgi:hypothetical protein